MIGLESGVLTMTAENPENERERASKRLSQCKGKSRPSPVRHLVWKLLETYLLTNYKSRIVNRYKRCWKIPMESAMNLDIEADAMQVRPTCVSLYPEKAWYAIPDSRLRPVYIPISSFTTRSSSWCAYFPLSTNREGVPGKESLGVAALHCIWGCTK